MKNYRESNCYVELEPNCYYLTINNDVAILDGNDDISSYSNVMFNEKRMSDHMMKSLINYNFNSSAVKRLRNTKVLSLSFEVTEDCNLRCKYCAYSGKYEHERKHSEKYMDVETIDQSIRFIKSKYNNLEEIRIAFYGGEPLLNPEFISYTIKKYEHEFQDIIMIYRICTNAVLISNEIADMIKEHNVEVQVSLDGPKNVNDNNRVSVSGNGTYDTIIKKVGLLNKKGIQNVSFSCTVSEPSIIEIANYFDNYFDSSMYSLNIAMVEPQDKYKSDNLISKIPENEKYYSDFYIKCLSEKKMNLFESSIFRIMFSLIHNRYNFNIFEGDYIKTNLCRTGFTRFFIRSNGDLSCCEMFNSCHGTIGNIYDDINFENLLRINKQFMDFRINTCSKCWAIRLCSCCQADMNHKGQVFQKSHCDNIRRSIRKNLLYYIKMKQTNPSLLKSIEE